MAQRIVVVGAGLVGSATAAELARRGHDVHVLERAVPGAEASSAAAGMLSPQCEADAPGPFFELCKAGLAATARAADAIRDKTGVDVELDCGKDKGGTLFLAFDDDEDRRLAARVAWQRAAGLSASLLDAREAGDVLRDERHAAATRVSDRELVGAAFFPDEGRLDPRTYVAGLAALAQARGATTTTGVPVSSLLVEGGRCRGVALADGARVEGDAVVVCAGAWTALVPGASALGLGHDDVFPMRGQIVQLQARPGQIARTLYGERGYVVPRRDGRIVCGSTMERAGFVKETTAAGLRDVLDAALALAPSLASAAVTSSWAGLRPGTKDGLPLLGATKIDGAFVSSGHFRNGVLLAAVSAEIIADVVEGKAPSVDIAAFSPTR